MGRVVHLYFDILSTQYYVVKRDLNMQFESKTCMRFLTKKFKILVKLKNLRAIQQREHNFTC